MRWLALLTATALAMTALARSPQASDPEVQLKAAIYKEMVDGDLEAAIGQYKQIVDNNGGDRAAAAKALLRLGDCYQKLGREEARNTFLRLVNDYPDQAAEVALARDKLTALSEASDQQESRPKFRKITIPGRISEGAQLSPDGTKLAFNSGGDIWTVELPGKVAPDISGEPLRLTKGADADWGGLSWSRNGQWISFNQAAPTPKDMYVVSASGGVPRKVSVSVSLRGGSATKAALDLSPDGSNISYAKRIEDRLALHMASVTSGEDVTRLADPTSTQPAFSPDGKYVAYVKSWEPRPNESRSEVRVVRIADRRDVRVTEILRRARGPVWSPDGNLLAFLIQPKPDSSSQEIWITRIGEAGQAVTEPAKIRLPKVTYNRLAGWTSNNKIGLLFPSPRHAALYTVPQAGGKATQVTPEGWPFHPRWSPDGERIYFRWDRGDIASVPAAGGGVAVVSRGHEQVIETLPGGGNHVSSDGTRIVFSGYKEGLDGVHLWTMPTTGGEPVRLPMKPALNSWCPRWSPDGKWIAFRAEKAVGDEKLDINIHIVSSDGGEPRQLTNHTGCYCMLIAWSPDGNTIAYTCSDGAIRVIPVRQGQPRTVVKVDGLGRHSGLAWAPDGGRLIYSAKRGLWSVSVAGGEPTEINTGLDARIGDLALSPDGERIAFNAGSGGEPELWLMEDFLDLLDTRR